MNGRTRKKQYDFLCKRDGEYCKMCGKLPWEGQLVIDHIDNDNSNNSLNNLQILCRGCNYVKNPRKGPLDMCVSSNTKDSLVINRSKEPKFREYVYMELDAKGVLVYDDIINSGAEIIEVSPETTKRYIRKMCSKQGKLEIFMDWDGASLVYSKRVKSIRYKQKEISFE